MTTLYKRNLTVQIGDDSEIITIPNDFKIRIDIEQLISGTSNSGTIQIFNLADKTKELIRDKGKRIRIFGGYNGVSTLIHDGQILYTTQIDQQADRITVVYLGGRAFNVSEAEFSKSYQGNVSIRQIVLDALPTFNLAFNEKIVSFIPANATIPNFSFSGKTKDVLDQLLRPLNFQWFERNSEILFSKNGDVTADQRGDIQVLNSNTGLIKTAVQTDRGVNVIALLNPQLQVGRIVKIESNVTQNTAFNTFEVQKPSFNTVGFYKIIQANYQGDNWDGKFEALLRCVPYDENLQP